MSIYTITAGHGGTDPGAIAADGVTTEAALMTELRDVVAHKLRALGHTVRTDGGWRKNLPLPYAMTLVPGSKVALELHTNGFVNPAATGVEVVSLPEHKELARTIARGIAHALKIPVRGSGGWIDQTSTKRGRLGFVRVGGLVVETFFITNPKDLETYNAVRYRVADAIVGAIT